jgi:biopolymer transport protein ExbB
VGFLTDFGGNLLKYYIDGGGTMHFILALSVVSLTVIVYKLIAYRRLKMNLANFVSQVRKNLLDGNVKGAIEVCEAQRSPVASITKSALLKYGQPRHSIEKAMENAAIHEVAYLEKYLTVLATVANIAPLLGFLGTVVGMILSFDVIAAQGLNNPGLVAKGISVALITTAFGLIVAFVTQPFYNYFTSKVSAYTREIETAANILFETFDDMERIGSDTGGAKAAAVKSAG